MGRKPAVAAGEELAAVLQRERQEIELRVEYHLRSTFPSDGDGCRGNSSNDLMRAIAIRHSSNGSLHRFRTISSRVTETTRVST